MSDTPWLSDFLDEVKESPVVKTAMREEVEWRAREERLNRIIWLLNRLEGRPMLIEERWEGGPPSEGEKRTAKEIFEMRLISSLKKGNGDATG